MFNFKACVGLFFLCGGLISILTFRAFDLEQALLCFLMDRSAFSPIWISVANVWVCEGNKFCFCLVMGLFLVLVVAGLVEVKD